jgi:hypothetical protein
MCRTKQFRITYDLESDWTGSLRHPQECRSVARRRLPKDAEVRANFRWTNLPDGWFLGIFRQAGRRNRKPVSRRARSLGRAQAQFVLGDLDGVRSGSRQLGWDSFREWFSAANAVTSLLLVSASHPITRPDSMTEARAFPTRFARWWGLQCNGRVHFAGCQLLPKNGEYDANQKRILTKIWQGGRGQRETRDAQGKARNPNIRQRREGWNRYQPQASHRDRSFRSAEERCEGSSPAIQLKHS